MPLVSDTPTPEPGAVIRLDLPNPTAPDATLGLELTLGRLIGRGATGAVYEATDAALARTVALKVILPDRAEAGTEAFRAEATRAAHITHPHVLPILAAGTVDDAPCFAMPFIAGGSLADAASRIGRIDTHRLARIVQQVASALEATHAAHLIHGDVKPANILLHGPDTETPHAFLTDFGAGLGLHNAAGPLPSRTLGTLGFAAPEQLAGLALDARADVYALGATVYWCLTGDTPSPALDGSAPVTYHRPDLDPAIDAAVGRALSPDPAGRYPNARAAAEAMAEPLNRGPRPTLVGATLRVTTPTPPRRSWRRGGGFRGPNRKRIAVIALAATLLTALGASAYVAFGGTHSRSTNARTAEQARLLAAVPEPLRASCAPTAPDARARAALQCTDPRSNIMVRYDGFSDDQALDAWFAAGATPAPTSGGTCANGGAGTLTWRARKADAAPAGRIRCTSEAGKTTLTWTTTTARIGATAVGSVELTRMWSWWQQTPGPVGA